MNYNELSLSLQGIMKINERVKFRNWKITFLFTDRLHK